MARVDETGVDPVTTSVEGSGAFTVGGEYYSVLFKRQFRRLNDAEAWAKMLESSPTITVRYNPKDPSDNVVHEQW